jgi:purine-binding chemotaxis protein CheW
VTAVPNTPPEVRGVINLRGKIIELMDLRVKLGLPPLRAEVDGLIQLLREREQDHRDWLAELEACVRERRPFGKARDPHKCKFGMWYDQFKTEDRLLRMTLPSMDAPHKAIHATADVALRQAEGGDVDGALGLIAERRSHELGALIMLFEESRRILVAGNREVAVVLSSGKDLMAFSADLVEAAEHIPEDRIEPMPAVLAELNGGLNCRVGKRPKTNQTILLLGHEFFFNSAAGATAQPRRAAAA